MAERISWFDSHAHLQTDAFREDLTNVLARAVQAGIERILLPGSNRQDSQSAMELAQEYADLLVCSVGIHPHHADEANDHVMQDLHNWIQLHRGAPIVAVGEIGLDYHYDFSPRDVQKSIFERHLDLAWETDLPLIIHEREATADCLAILHRQAAAGRLREQPGVFHCFSGSVETARIVLDMGFSLGFDGPVTFKNARKSHDVIRVCPLDRLLIETDSPYLTPVPFRGKRNEPANVILVGEKIAELLEMEVAELAKITTANAHRLFKTGS